MSWWGDRADKTVAVMVEAPFRHPLYGKQVKAHEEYHAHDEAERVPHGRMVAIMESGRFSKTKRWRVVELIERPD